MSRRELSEKLFVDLGVLIRQFHHRKLNSNKNLTKQQIRFLLILKEHGNGPMKYFSEHLCISKSNFSKFVDDMIHEGYVERSHSEEDRRIVLIDITDKGKKELKVHYEMMLDEAEERLCGLSDEEVREALSHINSLIHILGKVRSNDRECDQ